jgi:murein DD-endopeptidase MepM/ murein hydrolase activator NlpD
VRIRGTPLVGALGCVGVLCTAAVVSASDDSATRERPVADLSAHDWPQVPRRLHHAGPSDALHWPLHGAVTGYFGELRAGHVHTGIDIPMPVGTPIRAAGRGTVVMRELQQGYGKYTCIAHRTITTCYGHQSRFRVRLGEKVRRGEVIGEVGSTGNTTAPHLHFEVRHGTSPWGKPMNPKRFLRHRGRS